MQKLEQKQGPGTFLQEKLSYRGFWAKPGVYVQKPEGSRD
jgi:hypothetical protein